MESHLVWFGPAFWNSWHLLAHPYSICKELNVFHVQPHSPAAEEDVFPNVSWCESVFYESNPFAQFLCLLLLQNRITPIWLHTLHLWCEEKEINSAIGEAVERYKNWIKQTNKQTKSVFMASFSKWGCRPPLPFASVFPKFFFSQEWHN